MIEVKWTYSKSQLEAAVKFISKHNENFYGKDDYIRESILGSMHRIVEGYPNTTHIATMGYIITYSVDSLESMDDDETTLSVEVWVDPTLGARDWSNNSDWITQTINVKT